MAQEIIDIGAQADDGSGDTIRRAGLRINTNFTEVYALPAHLGDIKFRGNNITSESSNADIVLSPSGTGNVVFPTLTFEDNNIKDKAKRTEIFGQYDHVRIYGSDYYNRLESVGFKTQAIDFLKEFSPQEIESFALPKNERIPLAKK